MCKGVVSCLNIFIYRWVSTSLFIKKGDYPHYFLVTCLMLFWRDLIVGIGATSPIGLTCKYLPLAEAISSAPNISHIACHLRIPTGHEPAVPRQEGVCNVQVIRRSILYVCMWCQKHCNTWVLRHKDVVFRGS